MFAHTLLERNREFVYLRNEESPDEQQDERMQALAAGGHPVITLTAGGASDLGRIFFFAEFATAVAGWVLGINPFDQPNVQEAKDATSRVLGESDGAEPEDAGDDGLKALLGGLAPPHYFAVMGYVQPSDGVDAAVAELRSTVRDATRATTTFGYGPRFLHSTGQFHKGGPKTGRFLQLIHDSRPDVDVPGKPYTFTRLKHAQAAGDLQTLRAHGLPAERVTLGGADPAAALRKLTSKIKEML